MREMSQLECLAEKEVVDPALDIAGYDYATELHLAVKENDVAAVRKLIESGARVHAPDRFGRTPLHWALVYGYQEAAKALILNTNKRALDSRDSCGCTPLHYAALGGRTEVGRILIERGAQVNSVDSRRRTPLHFAAQHPKPAMVEMLISRGADKHSRDFREYLPFDIALEWASFSSLACLRPDSQKDSKLKVHPVDLIDGQDGGVAIDFVPRKGPSLDKLLESWKSAETEARRKKEAESEVAAKAFAELRVRLEEWRTAEQDSRQRQRGDARPNDFSSWKERSDHEHVSPFEENPSHSLAPSTTSPSCSSPQPWFSQSAPVRALDTPSSSSSFANCTESSHFSSLPTSHNFLAPSSSMGDSSGLTSGFPVWLYASEHSYKRGWCRKEALLWCTEWEVELSSTPSTNEPIMSDEDLQRQCPPTSPRERKGKVKALIEEEPVWVQVWPKPSSSPPCTTTSLSPRSKTIGAT